MPDVTALFYIAIMAFYLLRSNDGSKLIITTIVLAAIPLFTSDYWQWLQLSGLLSVIILIIEKEKAGATAGGAIAVLVALFIGAFIASIIINAAWTFTSSFKVASFTVKSPLSYEWSTAIILLYGLSFAIPLFAVLRKVKEPIAFFGTNLIALSLAVLPHFCGSFIYGVMLSVVIITTLFLVAFVLKRNTEQRFMFTYMTMSGLLTSCIAKGIMVAYF